MKNDPGRSGSDGINPDKMPEKRAGQAPHPARLIREVLLQILYPEGAVCPGCGKISDGDYLCPACRKELETGEMLDS